MPDIVEALLPRIRDEEGLREALKRWFVDDLGMSYRVIDELAGLSAGTCAKIFCPNSIRHISASTLDGLLRAGGLEIALCVDEARLAKIKESRELCEK
jgi:hypothetical protein